MLVTQSCPTLCDPMNCSHQAPLSKGFSRQECWSGLPFPSPEKVLTGNNLTEEPGGLQFMWLQNRTQLSN